MALAPLRFREGSKALRGCLKVVCCNTDYIPDKNPTGQFALSDSVWASVAQW